MAENKRLLVGIPSLVAAQALDSCVRSFVHTQKVFPGDILIVSNGPKVYDVSRTWQWEGVRVDYPSENLGVSGSWNHIARRAWELGYDAVFISNDDITITDPTMYKRLVEHINEEENAMYLVAGFGLFVLTKKVWDEVGEFDEGFWPAYMEDNDYHWRVNLKKIPTIRPVTTYNFSSSLTSALDPAIAQTVRTLAPIRAERYIAKWGGMPAGEVFETPWNGGEPFPGLKEIYNR